MNDSVEEVVFSVDIKNALDILGGNVFSGPEASIRELISNAADGILRLPPEEQGNPEIRLVQDSAKGVLSIADTGLGMSREDAKRLLGRLFASDKLNRHDEIGRFGIGFYSCFSLCTEVEVLTKSLNDGNSGTRIRYAGGYKLQIDDCSLDTHGTTVNLHLKLEHRKLLDEQHLRSVIQKYCNFIRVPIYVGHSWNLVNSTDAPWYHENASDEALLQGLSKYYDISGLYSVVQLFEDFENGRIHGVLYVPQNAAQASIRLFSKRILVVENEQSLLDESLRSFIGGVFDVDDIPLIISRDAIVGDSTQAQKLRRLILSKTSSGIQAFAGKQRADFLRFMDRHGPALKQACIDNDELRITVRDGLLFQTSMRNGVTIPEYLANRNDNTVIFADDRTLGASLIPLYNQANIEVVYMTDPEDALLRKHWWHAGKRVIFKRLDVDPPSWSGHHQPFAGKPEPVVDASILTGLRMLFASEVDEQLKVEVRSLGADAPAAILAIPENDRKMLQIAEAIQSAEGKRRLQGMPEKFQQLAKLGIIDMMASLAEKTIILNHSNEIVRELTRMIQVQNDARPNPAFSGLLANFLYGQALLASGMQIASKKLSEIAENQTKLIASLLKELRTE